MQIVLDVRCHLAALYKNTSLSLYSAKLEMYASFALEESVVVLVQLYA